VRLRRHPDTCKALAVRDRETFEYIARILQGHKEEKNQNMYICMYIHTHAIMTCGGIDCKYIRSLLTFPEGGSINLSGADNLHIVLREFGEISNTSN